MLKKKEWLEQLKKLLQASGIFTAWNIQEAMKVADEGWKKELSPGEAADELIEHGKDCLSVIGAILIC